MARILLTAFAPFAHWEENSSWLALQSLTYDSPAGISLKTRRYPVDYALARQQLETDLEDEFDFVLSMGQSARANQIELEAIAVNVAEFIVDGRHRHQQLCSDGPVAYQTGLPVELLADLISGEEIPCRVSYHAGTYLCNATYYWSQYLAEQRGRAMQSLFIHLPLAPQQVADVDGQAIGETMSSDVVAQALRVIMRQLAQSGRLA